MAIGDDAAAAGYPLVPDTGEDGRVRWGGREFNRTRDFIAQVRALIPGSKPAYRTASGIKSGYADPNGGLADSPVPGNDGDIYLRLLA